MHDCFISYSHKDTKIAVTVQSILEQNGVRCWIDFRDATPGIDYAASIVRAIKSTAVFVLILSQSSSESIHVLNEVNSAVNAGATILPFKVDGSELNDSMEYYLGRTHWMDALTPPLESHIIKLADTIKLHKKVTQPDTPQIQQVRTEQQKKISGCRMLKYEDLLSLGYTASSIALQLVENDYINCNGIGLENEGTAQQWEEYLRDNSETFQYLVNENNKIIGDWSIVALSDESFNVAKQGELLEADIDINKTELICFPGIYRGYILTFSILPEYRNMKNYNVLIESFLDQLDEYSENGIYFKEWCINVFSKEVESLVKKLGFKYIVDNKVFGKIYYCNFIPLPNLPIYNKRSALVERYKNAES